MPPLFTSAKTAFAAALLAFFPLLATGQPPAAPVSLAHNTRLIVRLINADTGDPMSHQPVIVEWDTDGEESTVYIGGSGRGEMSLLPGGNTFTVRPGFKDWGDPNRLAYYSCSGATTAVPVIQALRSGFVARNECNGRTVKVHPGEIVFWARPLPLWRPDFQ